jgi:hypothetical protein
MLTATVKDPRAWCADTIDPPASWYYRLPARLVDALGPLTDLAPPEGLRSVCEEGLRPVVDVLEHGRGFVLLDPADGLDDRQRVALYWLLGQALGRPIVQNVQGTLLYDVRDTGQDVKYGARFSVTSAESSFHTDNSFGDGVADYVGLLCLRDAREGGESQLVSGYAAHNELLAGHADALEVLRRPFHVDRRGGVRPGEAPTARYPVVGEDDRGLVFRYLRYWIEAGHDKAGEPLTPAQVGALDTLDETLRRPELRVTFQMRPGEVLLINNRWLLHNRTGFVDHEEPERRRHMVRLWLARA